MPNYSVNLTMDKRQQFILVNILDDTGNSVKEFGTSVTSLGPKVHQKLLLQEATSFVKSLEVPKEEPKEVPTNDLKEPEVPKEEIKVPISDLKEIEGTKEEFKVPEVPPVDQVPEVPKEVPNSDLNGSET